MTLGTPTDGWRCLYGMDSLLVMWVPDLNLTHIDLLSTLNVIGSHPKLDGNRRGCCILERQ